MPTRSKASGPSWRPNSTCITECGARARRGDDAGDAAIPDAQLACAFVEQRPEAPAGAAPAGAARQQHLGRPPPILPMQR